MAIIFRENVLVFATDWSEDGQGTIAIANVSKRLENHSALEYLNKQKLEWGCLLYSLPNSFPYFFAFGFELDASASSTSL